MFSSLAKVSAMAPVRDGLGRTPALVRFAGQQVRRCCGRSQKRLLQGGPL